MINPKSFESCQSIEIPLKPLNLHQKILQIEQPLEDLLLSRLHVRNPSLCIHDSLQWMQNILPDVPTVVDQARRQIKLMYTSSLIGTFLIVQLTEDEAQENGEIEILTDNYSVLTIIKVSQVHL